MIQRFGYSPTATKIYSCSYHSVDCNPFMAATFHIMLLIHGFFFIVPLYLNIAYRFALPCVWQITRISISTGIVQNRECSLKI